MTLPQLNNKTICINTINNILYFNFDDDKSKLLSKDVYICNLDFYEINLAHNNGKWEITVSDFPLIKYWDFEPQLAFNKFNEILLRQQKEIETFFKYCESKKDSKFNVKVTENNIHKIRFYIEEASMKFLKQKNIQYPFNVLNVLIESEQEYISFLSYMRDKISKFKHIDYLPYYPNNPTMYESTKE